MKKGRSKFPSQKNNSKYFDLSIDANQDDGIINHVTRTILKQTRKRMMVVWTKENSKTWTSNCGTMVIELIGRIYVPYKISNGQKQAMYVTGSRESGFPVLSAAKFMAGEKT